MSSVTPRDARAGRRPAVGGRPVPGGYRAIASGIALSFAALLIGGGIGPASTPAPLSPQVFHQRVTAICATANAEVQALPAMLADPTDVAGVAQLTSAEEPIVVDLLRQLRRIGPPPAQATLFAQAVAKSSDQLATLERLLVALDAGNASAIAREIEAGNLESPDALWIDLGLPECARTPQPSG